jgi:hypothetical protein
MLKPYIYIITALLLLTLQAKAQFRPEGSNMNRQNNSPNSSDQDSRENSGEDAKKKPKIPSIIKSWEIDDLGSTIRKSELDTALIFYHNYMPIFQKSISNTFTGNNGGAYVTNDFFKRVYNSDFYFTRSFDAFWLTPSQIKYINTTTPYSMLDYSQSENRQSKNETRFNVFLSQNVNRKLNLEFIYNQTRSQGHYLNQLNKYHNIALATSYLSNNFLSHTNIIFNRFQGQENGGIDPNQPLDGPSTTDQFTTQISDKAFNTIKSNNLFTVNEYRLGKTIPADSVNQRETFIPRVGFIHQLEYSGNNRYFSKEKAGTFFKNIYADSVSTNDSTRYNRLTNIFQIKFYEAPDRKYTFGKRAYIGNDQLWYNFTKATGYYPEKRSNTFIGGGIFRNEGRFWQWQADGRIYITGYRAGQTELSGFVNKPLKIGRDTTSLRIEGSLKTLVPEYYDRYYYSNHFEWQNNFSNINEMTVRASIRSQLYRTTLGANYSLIGNYIYNNTEALPTQAGGQLLMLSAYLNKDFQSDHWLIRTQVLAQSASNESYIHLPAFAGFLSINYITLWSKVLHTQLGIDTRYNTEFYADAYEPATARFYLQNKQKIGNYPFIDLHANLKLKRTRFFFILLNAASGLVGNNYFVAPDYPYYRRTFRLGISWSFYN